LNQPEILMLDALIAGRLHGQPKQMMGKSGKPFVVCKLKVAAGGEQIFCNVIAFETQTCEALLALQAGDSVALAGSLTPKAWTDKEGVPRGTVDVTAHAVVSAYSVTRKRKAMLPKPDDRGQPEFAGHGDFDGAQG
jgi:single-stranded DNA-binding protein